MVPFRPTGATVNVDVGATTDNVGLGACDQVLVTNDGTATAWIEFGVDDSVEATLTASIPIGAGVAQVFTLIPAYGADPFVAAIAAGATGKIYFTPGIGL